MNLLVTGGAGFIGSNFTRFILERTPHTVTVFDALTYAGNLANLDGLGNQFPTRYRFIRGDIADPAALDAACQTAAPALIVNFAAESHVDRSIHDATAFLHTNVNGTQIMLDTARRHTVNRVLHVGTDEVYGSLGPADPPCDEHAPLQPNSPYAASKAAADLLCRAAFHTHGLNVLVARCTNNYGPFQFPEKLIPLMIVRALDGQPLPVYGDGRQVRDWLHVLDHCDALWRIAEHGRPGQIYNIGGNNERLNIDVVRTILRELNQPPSLIHHVPDRLGHDRRYALNPQKIRHELNWQPAISFERGLTETVAWYVSHPSWWRPILSGEYRQWVTKHYGT